MLKSKLYCNLVDATRNIVNQFGISIIQEDRFIYILSDMCPDRDNPALFKIIKSASHEDVMQNLLTANAKTIEHVIINGTYILSKKYGYDSTLTEGLLYSVSVGAGIITPIEYNTIAASDNIRPKSNPSKNQASPPTKKRTNNPSKKLGRVSPKFILGLILGLIGLLISPIAYLSFMDNGWWPLGCTIVIACIHLFTLVGMSATLSDSKRTNNYPFIAGSSNAVLILAIIFWFAFPFLCGIESFLAYFGIYNKESFPWIVTIICNAFCAMILAVFIPDINKSISGIKTSQCKTFNETTKVLFASSSYRKGFFMICLIALFEAIIIWVIPQYKEWQWKNELETFNRGIENINRDIESLNNHKDSLRNSRSKQYRELAFKDFVLDCSYSQCLSLINSRTEHKMSDSVFPIGTVDINGKDYHQIIDNYIRVLTDWNNEEISIELYFSQHKLILLSFSPNKTPGDSIVSIYTNKYGEPEYRLQLLEKKNENDYIFYVDDLNYIRTIQMNSDTCRWTFKNGMIEIVNRERYLSNEKYATIKYFNRSAESWLQNKIEEDKRLQQIAEQYRRDSLNQVRDAEERLRREQREREELNHQKSINQI